MAGNVSYVMSTQIAIDTIGAQKSMSELNGTVKSSISAMKAAIAQSNSYGDSLGSQQSKVTGLESVMSNLQAKIDSLKQKQQGLSTENSKGAEQFNKLQTQIDNAKKQMANYSAQQDRAKQSLNYYSSGLAEVQRSYQATTEKTEAYANRLKAEGNEVGATKAKLTGYKSVLTDLQQALQIQESELAKNKTKLTEVKSEYETARNSLGKLKQAGKENTDEYKKQASEVEVLRGKLNLANKAFDEQSIRVNKTGTSIAETKTKTKVLSEELDKNAPQGFFKSLIGGFKGSREEANKTKSATTGVMSVFGGGAMLAGVMAVTSGIKSQAKAGYEDAKAAEAFQSKFENMGASKKQTEELGNSIKQIKENSNISGSAVTSLTQQFFELTGSTKKTQDLTKGVASLADALHLSGDKADAFSGSISKIEHSGKVTGQSLNRLEKQAPGLSGAMAKAAGMSQDAFNKLISSGKMTSSQFNDILTKASGSFDKNAKTFNSTTDGATHHMQTSWADTRKALMKPLVKVSSSGLNELSKVLDNKQTQSAAGQLGTAIGKVANACSKVVAVMSGSMGSILSIIGSITKIIGLLSAGIWDTFVGIGKTIANVFNDIFGKSKKSINPLSFVAKGLKEIASHKNAVKAVGAAIGGIIAPILAVKGAIGVFTMLKSAIEGVKMATLALKVAWATNPLGIAILAFSAVAAGVIYAYNKIKPFHNVVNSLGKMIKNVFFGIIDFFKHNWKTVGLFMLNPFLGIGKVLYDHVKPFRNFVNNVTKLIKVGFGVIGKFFSGFFSGLGKLFSTSLRFLSNDWNQNMKVISTINRVIWNGISSFLGVIWKTITTVFRVTMDVMTGNWSGAWNIISNIGRSIWNGISSFFSGAWNGFKNIFNGTMNFLSNIWNNGWNNISGFGRSIWNTISSVFSGFTGGIKNIWNNVTSFVSDLWSKMWDNVAGAARSAVSTVGHIVGNIANSVIRPINSMLDKLRDGINWILDKVGGNKIGKFDIPLVSYARGTKDTHQGGLAMVNDAPGSNYREMYQLPTGQIGMFPAKRNMVIPLPKGTSVLDGDKSAILAKQMGIPAYASGVGNFFSGLWNGAKDIFEDVEKILKDPISFAKETFHHFVGGLTAKAKLPKEIIEHFPGKLASEAANWIKKQFEDMAEPGGTGVARWRDTIKRALSMNGLPTSESYISAWLRQIATESSGNPRAVQGDIGDVNNATGDLAKGLLQTISSTFNSYAFAGHHNIFNGFDNALAAIHYAKSTYGSDMLGVIGHGHGYANGGYVNQHQLIEVAEGNKGEFIIPTDPNKRNRSLDLLDQANVVLGNNKQAEKQHDTSILESEVRTLKEQVSDLINLQKQILNANLQSIKATYDTAQDPNSRYRMDARNGSIRGYQALDGGAF